MAQKLHSLTIGQLARVAEVSVQTIRFYERKGILVPAPRNEAGYRIYNPKSILRLKFVRQAKNLGFTLRDINELLKLKTGSSHFKTAVRNKAQERLKDVQGKIRDLKRTEQMLKELVSGRSRGKVDYILGNNGNISA